jgi:hypothetical protein
MYSGDFETDKALSPETLSEIDEALNDLNYLNN